MPILQKLSFLEPSISFQSMSTGQALLLIAFGTSHDDAASSYQLMEEEMRLHFSTESICWSYTSGMIRKKLAAQGIAVPSIGEIIASLCERGVRTVRVQSLHIAPGKEFSEMERELVRILAKNPGCFDHVFLGRPLLESERDRDEAVAAVLAHFTRERTKDEAILFMAHGQRDGRGDLVFSALADEFQRQDPLTFVATLEGGRSFDQILGELKEAKVHTVWLSPFLFLAGKHVKYDLAGDSADSWATRLKQEGFSIKTDLRGLGENPGIRSIFLRHAIETNDDLAFSPKRAS